MCLILLACGMHRDYPLIVAANRDEFHARPAAGSHFWLLPGGILAGRDLEAGGTWLGLNSEGHFAAVTNVSETAASGNWLSRGALVQQFLTEDADAATFPRTVDGSRYRGFNLLTWDGGAPVYSSNRGDLRALGPGIHGLANRGLGEDRFKVRRGSDALAAALKTAKDDDALIDALLALLSDRTPADTPEPPGVPGRSAQLQAKLGACFIVGEDYGTRASTVVLANDRRAVFTEQVYAAGGVPAGCSQHRLSYGTGQPPPVDSPYRAGAD